MLSLDKSQVIILSAFLTPFRSGAEACAEEVAVRLSDKFDITIVTARLRYSLPRRSILEGKRGGKVTIMRVGFGYGFDKWLYPFLAPFVVHASTRASTRGTEASLCSASSPYSLSMAQHDVLIIHAILETFAGLALHFCRYTVPSAKRLLTCQTTNRSFLKGMIVRSADKVTVISNALQEIVLKLGRYDASVIPNGIDLPAILSACERNKKIPGRILFVGRLERMKGVDVLLHAFSQVMNHHPDAHLRIVGEGSQRKTLERLAESLYISDRITFTGFIPVPDVYEEFAEAEIFCGLSRSEALGNVFLEAQSAGCAVISTRVGGIVDIVKVGETGILVESDDALQASIALRKLLDDAFLRQSLARAGMVHAEAYAWDRIASLYSDLYRK